MTKKIAKAAVQIKNGVRDTLFLGNLNAKRDWGYAPDYVESMWKILQHDQPDDFVVATGETHTVKEFVELSFQHVGIEIDWEGEGVDEKGFDKQSGKQIVGVDPWYFRPSEVDLLIGDSSKAERVLGWKPKVTFHELVDIMVKYEVENFKG